MQHTESPESLVARARAKAFIEFEEVIQVIDDHYETRLVGFSNGLGDEIMVNAPGANVGSLKILSFAKMHGLSRDETLSLFGKFYREDVLLHPDGKDHPNIRNFMKYGWAGVRFDELPLKAP